MRNITLATLFVFLFTTVVFAAAPFSDVKASHWAYDAISKLAAKGYIEGYKDGTFKGEKNLTRYEVAMVISRLIDRFKGMGGVSPEDLRTLEKLTVEFSDELALLGVKVTALEDEMKMVKSDVASIKNNGAGMGKISITGDFALSLSKIDREFDTRGDDDWFNTAKLGLNFFMNVDEDVTAFVRFMDDEINLRNLGATNHGTIDEAYIDIKNFFSLGDLRVGRQWMSLGHSIVLDDKLDGIKFSKVMDQVAFTMFAFSTRRANANVNDQHYGDTLGTNNFYMFSDRGAPSATVAGAYTATTPAAYTIGDAVTLYNTMYRAPQVADAYTGSTLAATRTDVWNQHVGVSLNGGQGGHLAPVDAAAYVGAKAGVRPALTAYAYNAFLAGVDSKGLQAQGMTALARNWDVQSANGLDSFGLNISVDFGGHALAGYYMQRDYDKYDPYTTLGDPFAAMVDYNNDGVIDFDAITGRDLSPSANPTYWGITLDGNILRNLDYFFEYVSFDADINNIGVDPLTGKAVTAGGTWNGNNLNDGKAWLLGLDWDLTDDLNLIVQYGVGDEEFVPASIYKSEYLNGMQGRWNSAGMGLQNFADLGVGEGSGSLTGVKDLMVKFSADFNDKTSGYIKYEVVKDNDSSAARMIAGDAAVIGHLAQDYKLITLKFKHIYKPNTVLGLQYDYLQYDNDAVNDAHVTGNEAFATDDVNMGGWQRITADVQVKF
jgi:hypothetical protein